MATPIRTLKKDLRKKIRETLSQLTKAQIASQTSNATRALLSLPEYKSARRISIYLSMPTGEISTTGIVKDALEQGKQVFIPYTYKLSEPKDGQPNSIMDMLELQSMDDFKSLEPDSWGIPTPAKDSIASRANSFGGTGLTSTQKLSARDAESGLDLIVMPGMAFDSDFGRLGHGKGFYDFFLSRCSESKQMPFRVGLALVEQFLPSPETVPMDTTDYRLDALVLGNEAIRRRAITLA